MMSEQLQPDRDDDDIQHYTLAGILPQGHALAVHHRLGIIAHLGCEGDLPHIRAMEHFTEIEFLLLLPILQQYPRWCSSALLLAHFNNTTVTPTAIERARERLDRGDWENAMRSVRSVISRSRSRLDKLGISIVGRYEQGYQLLAPPPKRMPLAWKEERSSDGTIG